MNQALSGRVQICGVAFDDLDLDGVLRVVVDDLAVGRGGWIVTPNVDILRQILSDEELAALVGRASLVVIDGAPVQWAGRIAGHKGVQRAPGASLALPLASAARDHGFPLLLLGGRPGAGEQAAANLQAALPGIRVNDHCPDLGFESDPDKWQQVLDAVRANAGGIVLCGFGCPKQERVMDRLYAEFPDTWFLGIGGTIDFLAGFVPRAPEWMQQAGFEWAYRLAVEPKRLARRYIVDGFPFAWRLMVWAAKERQQSAAAARRARRARPAVPVAAAPAAPVEAGRIERIDLDRRTVSVASDAPGRPEVELSFTDFLAQRGHEAVRSDPDTAGTDPSAPAGPPRIIDLRDRQDATGERPTVETESSLPAPRPAPTSPAARVTAQQAAADPPT